MHIAYGGVDKLKCHCQFLMNYAIFPGAGAKFKVECNVPHVKIGVVLKIILKKHLDILNYHRELQRENWDERGPIMIFIPAIFARKPRFQTK